MKVHVVIEKYAGRSPQMVGVIDGPQEMLEMQYQVYIMGSRSDKVVAQRARSAENFFLDIQSFKWDVSSLSAFQVATWYLLAQRRLGARQEQR